MNWFNWRWWRTTGCYHFTTCSRCLKWTPFSPYTLCYDCEADLVRRFGWRPSQRPKSAFPPHPLSSE